MTEEAPLEAVFDLGEKIIAGARPRADGDQDFLSNLTPQRIVKKAEENCS